LSFVVAISHDTTSTVVRCAKASNILLYLYVQYSSTCRYDTQYYNRALVHHNSNRFIESASARYSIDSSASINMSLRKRKPESSEDRNDNETPNSNASVGQKRKSVKGFANKVSVGNPSLAKLKDTLYQMGNAEVMEHFEPIFKNNKRLPKAEDLQPGADPHFVQASIVDLRWKLAEQRDLYGRPTGDAIAFGMNDGGQLGVVFQSDDGLPPTVVGDLTRRGIIQVAAAGFHSLGISESGSAYSWGSGDEGQLGRLFDSDLDQTKPTEIKKMHPSKKAVSTHPVRSPQNECSDVIAIDANSAISIFLTISGNVYVAGM
jgi:hypothetical protein